VYIFRNALINFQLGYGAAISAILLVINLGIALIYLRVLRARN
jgi:multiple sugar transport system permease protein